MHPMRTKNDPSVNVAPPSNAQAPIATPAPTATPKHRLPRRPGIRLTERDLAILDFINQFGFCEMPHLDHRFGLHKPRNYQVINRLIDARLVTHERVFYGRHGIYRLTTQGAKLTVLPPLARLPLGNYTHDITLIEVYLRLRSRYPEATWISARQLMRDKHADGVGQRGHLPDGILVFPDHRQIAIELELTMKSKPRLKSILTGYSAAFSYKEVWYYCPDPLVAPIASMAANLPFIKIHRLRELLSNSEDTPHVQQTRL